MIDYEVKIFNEVHPVASPLCAKNRFLSTQIMDYAVTPAAALWEMDNRTIRDAQTNALVENRVLVTYQLEVVATEKAKCRQIFGAIDNKMISMNFSKMSQQYVMNPNNAKIVRIVARYEAEIDSEGTIYRRS